MAVYKQIGCIPFIAAIIVNQDDNIHMTLNYYQKMKLQKLSKHVRFSFIKISEATDVALWKIRVKMSPKLTISRYKWIDTL